MVVLAAAVVSKAGKPLVARLFNPSIQRSRLESLLLSFVKLIPAGAQHTTLLSADKSMRFVYMPVDELYVVLLTPPLSNIIQDIDTLQLIGRIVSETCAAAGGRGAAGEQDVLRNSFELLSSFDEVVSLGYRERVGITDVRAAMEMESHEERIQEIIARNKEAEAKEELKRRAKQLEMQRREATKRGQNPYGMPSPSYDRPSYAPPPLNPAIHDSYGRASQPAAAKPFKGKGMQLGASKGTRQQAELLDALAGELGPMPPVEQPFANLHAAPAPVAAPALAAAAAPAARKDESPFGPVHEEEVHLVIREKLSLELNRDGGLNTLELKGDLDLRIASPAAAKVVIALAQSDKFAANDLQFKTHPNVDKRAWNDERRLGLKDPKRGFPTGMGVGVLKWRLVSKNEALVPININAWPSPSADGCDVVIEYEVESSHAIPLRNLLISIPLPAGVYPTVGNAEGSYSVNAETHTLDWTVDEVEPGSSGSLEFNVPGDDPAAFFPIAVDFASQSTMCGVQVTGVTDAESGAAVPFSTDTYLLVDDYAVLP